MFKTLKAIFSTPTDASKVADAVIKGADAAWFTKEEQSAWFLRYLEATQPQNLSRRFIAMAVSMVWVVSALVLLAVTLAGIEVVAENVFAFMSTVVNPVFYTVVGFYFAHRIAGGFSDALKK
jgi:hypothetical protein